MVGRGELLDKLRTIHTLVSEYNYSIEDVENMTPLELQMYVAVTVLANKEREEKMKIKGG